MQPQKLAYSHVFTAGHVTPAKGLPAFISFRIETLLSTCLAHVNHGHCALSATTAGCRPFSTGTTELPAVNFAARSVT